MMTASYFEEKCQEHKLERRVALVAARGGAGASGPSGIQMTWYLTDSHITKIFEIDTTNFFLEKTKSVVASTNLAVNQEGRYLVAVKHVSGFEVCTSH
jgi:hypothetical protein